MISNQGNLGLPAKMEKCLTGKVEGNGGDWVGGQKILYETSPVCREHVNTDRPHTGIDNSIFRKSNFNVFSIKKIIKT